MCVCILLCPDKIDGRPTAQPDLGFVLDVLVIGHAVEPPSILSEPGAAQIRWCCMALLELPRADHQHNKDT